MSIKSCVFICDENGLIQEIIRDDFGFKEITNNLLIRIIHNNDHGNSLDMFVDVKSNKTALNYSLHIHHNDMIIPANFSAVKYEKYILIIATEIDRESENFSDNLLEINNEQVNQLRTLLKEKANRKSEDTETELLFNQLSAVNNELINLQRTLNKKNSELTRLNEIKNHFIGMAAHDLRNPLINIKGMSDFLQNRSDKLDETELKFLTYIESQSTHLLKLVNELLDVSAIESGNVKLELQETDIISLIKENISINKDLAENKEIKVRCEADMKDLRLKMDPNKIDQVITNLITNAIKYSEPRTEITVSISQKNDKALVEVKDQGQGIAEDELDLLFKPFQKISSQTTGGEQSTGLGLFIIKRIIEAHKGTVGATSKVDKGSVFYFTLPLK